MRVLICGDREWADYEAIERVVWRMPSGSVVIEGDARGADKMAGMAAAARGLEVLVFPAQWDMYGKRAGVLRNQQMLDDGKPDIVVYCHDALDESKGTKDMVARATKAGIPVYNVRLWSR